MTGRRWKALIGVTASALVGIAGVGALVLPDEPGGRLAGAELLADGGEQDLASLIGRRVDGVSLDDVRVSDASLLTAAADGSLLVLVEGVDSALVRTSGNGTVVDVGFIASDQHIVAGHPGSVSSVAVGPDGEMAVALIGGEVLVRGFGWNEINSADARFDVGALAFAEDDTVLLGSLDDGRIDAVTVDGTVRHLLGPPEDREAEAHWNEPLGPIVSLVWLPDGRVAFVADTPQGHRLFLLDDGEVRPIEVDPPDLAQGVEQTDPEPGYRMDRLPVEPLAAGPDGRLLVSGLGPEGDPRISLVDVDTGEVEVLADLEGVEPTVERPVSAAAVGDDLVFLADGRVWKLEGAFAG